MSISVEKTLAELVTEDPRRADVMEAYRLDFCCGGTKALADAAAEVGMQEAELEELLTALDLPPVPQTGEVGSGRNAALAHDIVDTHHAYMWEEMPRLGALVEKVHRVHGDRHPELRVVLETYNQMIAELDPHMTREERSVFPVISKLEKGESPRGAEGLDKTIDELVDEHEAVGRILSQLRSLTDGYQTPPDACASYIAAYRGLEEMERDLHVHIHKENNILFPAALGLC